jgi:hypothetical protein
MQRVVLAYGFAYFGQGYLHCNENPIYVFLEKEQRDLRHSCVCERIYIFQCNSDCCATKEHEKFCYLQFNFPIQDVSREKIRQGPQQVILEE